MKKVHLLGGEVPYIYSRRMEKRPSTRRWKIQNTKKKKKKASLFLKAVFFFFKASEVFFSPDLRLVILKKARWLIGPQLSVRPVLSSPWDFVESVGQQGPCWWETEVLQSLVVMSSHEGDEEAGHLYYLAMASSPCLPY